MQNGTVRYYTQILQRFILYQRPAQSIENVLMQIQEKQFITSSNAYVYKPLPGHLVVLHAQLAKPHNHYIFLIEHISGFLEIHMKFYATNTALWSIDAIINVAIISKNQTM